MTLPTLRVLVAFATHPTATPTYTDVTAYVKSLTIRRGRQRELDRMEAGTCQIVLANHDRRFDPTNSTGPYAPNVLPMKRVQISAIHGGSTHWLFDGFVDEWKQEYVDNNIGWSLVRATDAFKIFALFRINKEYPSEISSDRIVRVLTNVGWSIIAGWETGNVWVVEDAASQLGVNTYLGTGGWAVYQGITTVQASTATNVNALEHVLAVADAENGQVFMSAAGDFVFHDRHHRAKSTISAVYSDTGSTSYGYRGIEFALDDAQLWNEVRVALANDNTQTEYVANDTASQSKYFVRTLIKPNLLLTSTSEALNCAQWVLAGYREPDNRVRSLTFNMLSHSDTTSFVSGVLGREIGDRVTVIRTPPGGGTISQPSFIEGVEHTLQETGKWTTTFRLSPGSRWNAWVLAGSTDSTATYSTSSVLDATTILGY